jgi:hypothetical protein
MRGPLVSWFLLTYSTCPCCWNIVTRGIRAAFVAHLKAKTLRLGSSFVSFGPERSYREWATPSISGPDLTPWDVDCAAGSMASVVREREIDITKLSLEQLNSLSQNLEEVSS